MYKRQFQHRIDPEVGPEEVAGVMADLIREGQITHWGISEANEDYLRPVSYTHLDVYKRQALWWKNPRWNPS